MAISESIEVETKFEVGPDTPVPAAEDFAPLAADPPVEHELSAVYYDTADLSLTRHKVTLRRRTGGDDEGWHLKLPARAGRVELHSPLADEVPADLVAAVAGLVRRRPLQPIARVDNHRHVTILRTPDGTGVVEFCDDHVSTESLLPGGAGSDWREWEIELIDPSLPGAADHLAHAASACVAAGAAASSSSSKLARAVGPLPERFPPGASPVRDALVADLDQILDHDPGARRGTMVGVHQMRVAVRGLRSTIGTYGAELEEVAANGGPDPASVAAELKVLAAVLGKVRDVQVVRRRLDALAHEYTEDVVDSATRERIRSELDDEERRAGARLTAALASDRYLDLLDRLHELVEVVGADEAGGAGAPTGASRGQSRDTVLRGVDRQFNRFARVRNRTERDLEALDLTLAQREELTHVVRKRAKSLRRNVAALPDDGELTIEPLRAACQRLHTVLGEVQDSVTTRQRIRRIARRAEAAGESTFGLGVLYERERAFSERTLDGFEGDAAAVTAAYRELEQSRRAARKRGKKKNRGKKKTKRS